MSVTRSYPNEPSSRKLSSQRPGSQKPSPHKLSSQKLSSQKLGARGDRPNLKRGLGEVIDELVRQGVPLAQARREFERQFIVASIRENDGNLGRSARSLGVHRNTLRNKVSSLGIDTAAPNGLRSQRRPPRRLSDDS